MGVIQKEGLKSSVVNYAGIIIGALSSLFIYPLDWEIYGNIQYWLGTSTLLIPLLRLGSISLIVKFYPYFRKNKIPGFLSLILIITFGTMLVMTGFLFSVKYLVTQFSEIETLRNFFEDSSFYPVYILSVLLILASILKQQSSNFRRIVIPEILTTFTIKLIIPSLVILSFYGFLDIDGVFNALVAYNLVVIFFLFLYSWKLGAIDINWSVGKKLGAGLKKDLRKYWIFGGLNYFGSIVAYKIDAVMIGNILNKTMVGYYSIYLFLASVLEIPFRSFNRISGPIISQAFEKNQLDVVEDIYKKSSKNLMVGGLLVFGGIWLNLDYLYEIMRNGQDVAGYKYIFLFLGLAKLFDTLTSVNNLILVYSKWYRYNLLFLMLLAVSNVTLNIFLINAYGIMGAGYATAISIFTFNLVKSIFIYSKFKMHPFDKKSYLQLLILVIILGIEPYINLDFHPVISVIITSVVFAMTFLCFVWFSKMSEEINKTIKKLVKKIGVNL